MPTITLAHNSESEQKTQALLTSLIAKYGLLDYEFTSEIVIDSDAIPHSHPVLTLHTRHNVQPNLLLATYVHEQLHWFAESRKNNLEKTIEDLKAIYPSIPVGRPEGAKSEYSSYLHIVINLLELMAVTDILGESEANGVMDFWENDHYTWIYKTVRRDFNNLKELLQRYDLIPELLLSQA